MHQKNTHAQWSGVRVLAAGLVRTPREGGGMVCYPNHFLHKDLTSLSIFYIALGQFYSLFNP